MYIFLFRTMQILVVHGVLSFPLNRQMSNKIETLLLWHNFAKQIAASNQLQKYNTFCNHFSGNNINQA